MLLQCKIPAEWEKKTSKKLCYNEEPIRPNRHCALRCDGLRRTQLPFCTLLVNNTQPGYGDGPAEKSSYCQLEFDSQAPQGGRRDLTVNCTPVSTEAHTQ